MSTVVVVEEWSSHREVGSVPDDA